jgi:AcrR family transcriptional regulator
LSKRKRLSADQRREVIEQAATEVFAERGYAAASIDEIARRSGVSAPVVYDHFASKADLHRRLLERHRDELVALWRAHLLTDEPPELRIPRAIDAWARYVEAHPYAWKMLFRETTGDPEAAAVHREVLTGSRALLAPLVTAQPGGAQLPAEMGAELIRSALTGLALWWQDHPEVSRAEIVSTAVNVLWLGFERLGRGERWQSPDHRAPAR